MTRWLTAIAALALPALALPALVNAAPADPALVVHSRVIDGTGAVADLLIVAGNPAEDITATRDIRSVIQAGKVLEAEPVDAQH
ncbi:MAG: hypothetical protein ACNA7W_03950 [Pseudomonadales bacterium]